MANQGEEVAVAQHIIGHGADVPGHLDRHRYHHVLNAARALMLLGAVAAVSTVGNPDGDDADAAAQVFLVLGFVAWLLGVCLLWLVPVAGRRFPQADALAGVATVLVYLFIPWN